MNRAKVITNMKATIATVLCLWTGCIRAQADTIVVRPDAEDGKDISLYERTDVPVSAGPSLYAIHTGPPGPGFDDFASLIQFDLKDVAPVRPIVAARLWLYENDVPTFSFQHVSSEFPNIIEVRPAAMEWSEETVFFSTLPEPVLGYSSAQSVDAVQQWFSWDVTDVVRQWLDGSLANHGFLITSQMEVRDSGLVVGSAFDASEQENPPYLEIEIMNAQPGDYDFDGVVDGDDLLELLLAFGSTAMPAGSGADGNGDGFVDRGDLGIWRDNLGFGANFAARATTSSVPEPPAFSLAALATAVLAGMSRKLRLGVCGTMSACLLFWGAPMTTNAVTVPFTEEFTVDGANWRDSQNMDVNYVPSGGIGGAGDGYISVERTFTANPDFAQTVFRAQDGFDSSGDALVGDWLSSGVTRFSYWVRHNAASDLTFGARFATSANSPGANGIGVPASVPPNEWTLVELPISPASITPEGPPMLFSTVFEALGNVQVSVRPGDHLDVPIRFDLDRVSIVPEPSSAMLLCVAVVAAVVGARRCIACAAGPAVAVFALLVGPHSRAEEEANLIKQSLRPLPEPLASFGAASHDGWLYVYGGHVGETHEHSRDNVRGSFRRQSLEGGSWEDLPGGPAVQSPALVAHGRHLYRIGGLSALNPPDEPSDLRSVSSVERYDPEAQSWEGLPPLPQPRSSHDAVVLRDEIYVAGGWNHHGEEGDARWHDSALVLNLRADAESLHWRDITPPPFKRRALALATWNGRLYCIGGMLPNGTFSRRVDIFDPQTRKWSQGPDLPKSDLNGFGSSAFEVGGRLYTSSRGESLLTLSLDGAAWTPAVTLQQTRFFHRIVPGARGSVLLVAGAGYDGHLVSIEEYRASSSSQASSATRATHRSFPAQE